MSPASLPQRKQPGPDDMPGSDTARSPVVQTCKNLRRSQDIHSGSRESAPIAADSRPRPLHTSGRAVSRLVASGLAGVPIPGVPGRVGNGSRSTDQDQPASCRCGADGHGGTSRVCPTTARTARVGLDLGNLALCVDGVNRLAMNDGDATAHCRIRRWVISMTLLSGLIAVTANPPKLFRRTRCPPVPRKRRAALRPRQL